MNEFKLFSPRIPQFEKSESFIDKIFLNNDEIIKRNKSLSSNNIFHRKKIDYNNNNNLNTLNSQISHSAISILNNPILNNTNNIEFQIFEKDKKLLELTNENKELKNQIENLNNQFQNKNYEILSLRTNITSLESDKKILNDKIIFLNEKISNLNNILENKEKELNDLMNNNDGKIKEINSVFNIHMKDFERNFENSKNLQFKVNELENNLKIKENTIKNLENVIFNLKKENNKIFSLEKSLYEKNEYNKNLENKLENIQENFKKIKSENLKLNNTIQTYMNNDINNNSIELNYTNLISHSNSEINTKLLNKKNTEELEKQTILINNLKTDLNKKDEEYQNIVIFFSEQIKFVLNCIENNKLYEIKFSTENKENYNSFDLIKKNFEILISRFLEIRNNDMEVLKFTKELIDREKIKNVFK